MAKPKPYALKSELRSEHPEAARRRAALARLHIAKKDRDIDDDIWRDVIERVTGKRSLKDLDVHQLHRVLDEVAGKRSAGAERAPQARTKDGAPRAAGGSGVVGPYAGKLRAMWLSGWNLGVIRDRSDAALIAFVRRQTGLDAIRFLREAAAAARAIEALKSWLSRTAGVAWGEHPDNPRAAVVDAQWHLALVLNAVGAHVPSEAKGDAVYQYARSVTGKTAPQHYTEEDWDRLIAALGSRIRAAPARDEGPTSL